MKNYFFIRFGIKQYLCLLALLSGTWSSYAQFPAPYCDVTSNWVDAITKVNFAGINRTSPAISSLAIEDFLTDTGIVETGKPYPIAVEGNTGGNYGYNVKVYIDWNQNNLFTDAGEAFDLGNIMNSTGSDGKQATANITVPLSASLGTTRMRVVMRYGTAINNTTPCPLSTQYIQAEDYTIKISASATCHPPSVTVTSMTATTATFTWGNITGASGYEYLTDQSAASPAGSGTSTTLLTATGLITGGVNNYIHVRTNCGGSYSAWTTIPAEIPFPWPYCPAIITIPEPITLVNFAGINRASSATVPGAAAIENYLSDTGTVIPGLPYPITVKANTNGDFKYVRAFCDWNRNGVFTDAGETYDLGELNFSTGVDAKFAYDTIIAPFNAQMGHTRMRVVIRDYNGFDKPRACSTNYTGQAEDYTIHVIQPPACLVPAGLSLSGITGSSVSFSWNTMFGANGYEYAVNTVRTPPSTGITPTTATNGSASSLAGNTKFYVHVRSDCGGGNYSAWVIDSFVTCTAPSGLAANNLTHYSASLSWSPISGIANYEYVIDQNAADPAGAGTVTTATTINDSTFVTNQTYYLHVRTHCGGGTYSAWTTLSFKTPQAFCFIGIDISVTNLLPTTATLAWYSFTQAKDRKNFEYVLDQLPTDPTVAGTRTTDTLYNATNLQPNTTYYMHVRTDCYGGLYSVWRTREFKTLPVCYTVPSGLTVSKITTSSATLSWNAVSSAVAYEYVVDQSAADPAGNGTRVTDTSGNKTGLTAGAVYYLHVRTECSNGDNSAWATYQFAVCVNPSNLTATNISWASATVGWDAVSGAAEYEYVVDLSSTPPAGSIFNSTKTTATTANISSLFPATAYYLHVRSNCGQGNFSPWETHGFITEDTTTTSVPHVTGKEFTFSIAPNPVRDVITYAVTGALQENSRIQILDLAGKVMYTTEVAAAKGTISISGLANGVYLVKYSTPAGNRFIRISKQ